MLAWFFNLISLNENEFKFCSSLTQCFLKSESHVQCLKRKRFCLSVFMDISPHCYKNMTAMFGFTFLLPYGFFLETLGYFL